MTFSPAAALEWRGYATVYAIAILRRNSKLFETTRDHAPI